MEYVKNYFENSKSKAGLGENVGENYYTLTI